MKAVLLVLQAIVAFAAAFVPSSRSPGPHRLLHFQSPGDHHVHSSPRHRNLNANKGLDSDDDLPEVDIQAAIHDVVSLMEQHTAEIRKAGVQLTKAIRNLEVEHQTELDNLDALIVTTKRKKKYVQLAYKCVQFYKSSGNLSWTFTKDSNQELYEEVKEVFTNQFDRDVFSICMAKHGFVPKKIEEVTRSQYKLELEFSAEE